MNNNTLIRFPDVGDIFNPSMDADVKDQTNMELILPGFQSWDVGEILNEREGHTFWQPGEMVQLHGLVRGVEVWIELIRGRMAFNRVRGYRVAFGPQPDYPEQVDIFEAARLLKENIPPMEYVRVTPEDWARRREA
jgi:hypothetical protein